MNNVGGRIEQHVGSFQYATKQIAFSYWSHLQSNNPPDAIIFLGTGQTGRIARWVAQAAPSGSIVVEGAPHWHAHPSATDLFDFMYAYTVATFQAVRHEFSLTSAHLIAQSQAAPGAVRLGNNYPSNVGNIVLVAPLGFAATIFGKTPEIRVRTLMRRAVRTSFQLSQSPLYDLRNAYVFFTVLQAILRESERGASKRKYATGLSYDVREDVRLLAERQIKSGKTITLLLGGNDKVFTPAEIQPLVESAGIKGLKVRVLPGVSHLSLAVRKGKEVLKTAVAIARQRF